MIHQCRTFLDERAAVWGVPQGGKWTFLFHNNYHAHHSNINLFWFHNGNRYPSVVTKVFPHPLIPTREFANQRRAYDCAPACVPRPLEISQAGTLTMLWQNGVPGTRVYRFTPSVLDCMVDTVAELHGRLRSGGVAASSDRWQRLVATPLETVAAWSQSEVVRAGCSRLKVEASPEWLRRIPVIPQHGDLFLDNFVVDRNRCSVVDWESFGAVDLPFYDLFTLLLSLMGVMHGTSAGREKEPARRMPQLVAAYANRLSLSPAEGRTLLPLALVNWFHLQWLDGRAEFAARTYRTIQQYFEDPESWNRVFAI